MILYNTISENELLNASSSLEELIEAINFKFIIFYIVPMCLIGISIILILFFLYYQNKLLKNLIIENNIQRQLLQQIEKNTGIISETTLTK